MRFKKIPGYISIAVQFLFFLIGFILAKQCHLFTLEPSVIFNVGLDLLGIFVCAIIFTSCFYNANSDKKDSYFLLLILCNASMLFLDMCGWFVQGRKEFALCNLIVNTLFYYGGCLIPLVAWLFQYEVMKLKGKRTDKLTKVLLVIFAIQTLLIIFNCFFGFYFTVDFETGIYSRSDYYLISIIWEALFFFISFHYILTRKVFIQIKVAFLFFNLLPFIAVVIQIFNYGVSIVYISSLIAIMIMYSNIQVNLRMSLEETRSRLLVSQIKPQFISNTLATVEGLCEVDPQLAAKTVKIFSSYLRANMTVLGGDDLIPFEKEIEFVKVYEDIEHLQFSNFKIEYFLEDKDFKIPSVSIAPMVENAILHGLKNTKEGLVKIHSYKEGKYHMIKISDNGQGFDIDKRKQEMKEDFKKHIGIENTEKRLMGLCGGVIEINSTPGNGTAVLFKIPEDKGR